MKQRTVEVKLNRPEESIPVPIIADASISTRGLHGGRLLPLLLLDTSKRQEMAEFIRFQNTLGPGDVHFQWGKIDGHQGTVAIFLSFVRPIEVFAILEFEIVRQGILVEQALTGQGIYLANAEGPDDRLIKNPDRPKVLVELPDTGFQDNWNRIFRKHVTQHFRDEGMGFFESRRASKSVIEELQRLGGMRMKDILPSAEPHVGSKPT